MTEPDTALRIEGLRHAYGDVQALDGVSLEAPAGRFTALLGANGAGKSTLVNLVTGLFAAQAGRVAICGVDMARDAPAALRRLGVVFQSRALDAALTVDQNLAYRAALHGVGRAEGRAAAAAALARLGVADLGARRVGALSGGQARRVEIAAALLHGPELLLCDEATVGLDVAARAAIVADAHALARETGVCVLWATHLIDEIAPDDAVVMLHRGRVVAEGRADALAGAEGLEAAFLRRTAEAAA